MINEYKREFNMHLYKGRLSKAKEMISLLKLEGVDITSYEKELNEFTEILNKDLLAADDVIMYHNIKRSNEITQEMNKFFKF